MSGRRDWVEADLGPLQVLRPERRVLFLDTDARDAGECEAAAAASNAAEAHIMREVIDAMAASGVPLGDIGLVSPFRNQVRRELFWVVT